MRRVGVPGSWQDDVGKPRLLSLHDLLRLLMIQSRRFQRPHRDLRHQRVGMQFQQAGLQ